LMSTHLLAIAEELADRVGIVDRGRMLAVGTLEELRMQLQHRGPLEELFLKLTGDRGRADVVTTDREFAGTKP
jgi:ABC-2 type transport system ATP-binding protein